jgi:hypothetical protein
MGSILLMLAGGLLAAAGLLLAAFGLVSVVAGEGNGHVGGWSLLAYGAVSALAGGWAVRRGRTAYYRHVA